MVKAISVTLLIAGLCICFAGLVQEWKSSRDKRRARAEHKRYVKKFRRNLCRNQRECDAMFQERKRAKQEDERKRQKWENQNMVCHNPELRKFLNGAK